MPSGIRHCYKHEQPRISLLEDTTLLLFSGADPTRFAKAGCHRTVLREKEQLPNTKSHNDRVAKVAYGSDVAIFPTKTMASLFGCCRMFFAMPRTNVHLANY